MEISIVGGPKVGEPEGTLPKYCKVLQTKNEEQMLDRHFLSGFCFSLRSLRLHQKHFCGLPQITFKKNKVFNRALV